MGFDARIQSFFQRVQVPNGGFHGVDASQPLCHRPNGPEDVQDGGDNLVGLAATVRNQDGQKKHHHQQQQQQCNATEQLVKDDVEVGFELQVTRAGRHSHDVGPQSGAFASAQLKLLGALHDIPEGALKEHFLRMGPHHGVDDGRIAHLAHRHVTQHHQHHTQARQGGQRCQIQRGKQQRHERLQGGDHL